MRRVFSDHAYDSGRISECYWAQTVPDKVLDRPATVSPQHADVVVIGGGFTGLSAALHLAQDGVDVAVVDAQFPGWGASGRNGGFCCLGGSMLSDGKLRRRYGETGRAAYRQSERSAVDLVAELIEKHAINADTHSSGETILAHNPSAFEFETEAAQIEADYGVTPLIISKSDLGDHGLNGPFHGAMNIPIGFALNPRKYTAGLLLAAEKAGARVFGHSPVTSMKRIGGVYSVATPTAEFTCDKVIVATNGYSSDDLPDWMAARYMPAQSSAIVTRPLSRGEIAAQGWHSDQMAYDTRNLLHYFRLMPDGRFLFGMRGGLRSTAKSDTNIRRIIRRDFDAMFPAWANVETPHYWTGMVCISPAMAPFCGAVPEMPGVYAGFAYHGNGVAMGTYTGALLADLVCGKSPRRLYPDAMAKPPKKFPLGRYRRALMWPGYAGAYLRDL